MNADRVAWHPGFASAMQLELAAYKGSLVFKIEYELNRQPLRIDLLVIKKDPNVVIENDIARIFRGHNILEFKSEHDGMTIDDLYKVMGYGCLYKAYGPGVDSVDAADILLTLVRRGAPRGLIKKLESGGCTVALEAPGVYYVDGLVFPTQIVVTGELEAQSHLWLSSLASGLEREQVRDLVIAAGILDNKGDRMLADSVLDVVTLANSEVVESLKEEDTMAKTLYEIMQPEIDEAIKKARAQAIAEGAVEAARGVVERLIRRGGFSEEEIAELAGTTTAEVREIAASLQLSPA